MDQDSIDINLKSNTSPLVEQQQQQHEQPQSLCHQDTTTTTTMQHPSSSINQMPQQPKQDQPQQQQSQTHPHRNHAHLVINELEKLDPDKNGLVLVPDEITSSTLTTRLKGVCKINRLIDYSNNLCHSISDIDTHNKYQESVSKFRDWIFKNDIIEHIFGPNCHVEIIKQSHTILNFVANSLTDEHVNVIWSAASLKHCGRQVLDLLISLIRFMRPGPVLHLYGLVKDLKMEDHSDHTLHLTSHILKFIWSHSPTMAKEVEEAIVGSEDMQCTVEDVGKHLFANASAQLVSDVHESSSPPSQDQSPQQSQIDRAFPIVEATNNKQQQQPQPPRREIRSAVNEREWLRQWDSGDNFLDNTSDVSACCSEEKNMDDFAEDSQGLDSSSSSRDSDAKFRITLSDRNSAMDTDFQESSMVQNKPPSDTISHYSGAGGGGQILENPGTPTLTNAQSSSSHFNPSNDEDYKGLSEFTLGNLSEPGRTFLWDLLQDGKIELIEANLHEKVESALVNLVMSFGDRYIRYKFIEACLKNLSLGTSVIISLKLLPKLMTFSPINPRNPPSIPAINETHNIVVWAEREHNMSQNFFKNLVKYYNHRREAQKSQSQIMQADELAESKSSTFGHISSILASMAFLTYIYSKPFSPETMRLTREQMDQLWDCLSNDSDPRTSDVLFQWIFQQAVGEEFHGLNDELLDYVLQHKLPALGYEHFRFRGLKLLEQLLWLKQDYECCHGLEHPGTKLLWDIALHAVDDEVSMSAIRMLNHFYIYTNHQKSMKCDKGINFMRYCMEQLQTSLGSLTLHQDKLDSKNVCLLLDVMQKVILLIRTHLEVFKAHWSYYLRILQLNNETDLTYHRLNAYELKLSMTVRLVCQAASTMDKTTIEVHLGDFVGELRAEIVKWWFTQVDRSQYQQSNRFSPQSSYSSSSTSSPSHSHSDPNSLNPFTSFLLANQHSLRLLSHNQEIPFDWDERQINELDFKDLQVIYVISDIKSNPDPNDDLASNKSSDSVNQSHFPKSEIPSILLIRQEYFERLMETDRFLGSFRSDDSDLTSRAKGLSRRVWEIIQILPTCPYYKMNLQRCGMPDDELRLKSTQCSELLNADCPQRLLYSLQIIDILKSSPDNPTWGSVFIKRGGLADIYDVFMSQKLLPSDNEEWNEWLQECLAYLLKLLFLFGTRPPSPSANESTSSSSSFGKLTPQNSCSSRAILATQSSNLTRRIRRGRNRLTGNVEDRLPIPLFSDELLKLLDNTDLMFQRLIWILKSSAFCHSQCDQYYYMTMSNRAMIIHYVMSFFASWCKSDPKFPKFQVSDYQDLLKALMLDDTDSSTRREACNGFYKLHQACTSNQWSYSEDLLKCLITFLPIAEAIKPPKPIRNYISEHDYIRELNSPGCKDYFWLTYRLIDSHLRAPCNDKNQSTESSNASISDISQAEKEVDSHHEPNRTPVSNEPVNSSTINLTELCEYLIVAIRRRETFETRDFSVEDDTLRGMLMMMVMALRRDPGFKNSDAAYDFVKELYDYLFAPPNQNQRYLPKCKSNATRSSAFDLMIALVERCTKNYFRLLDLLLMDQHNSVVKSTYPTDYWPQDDCRSEVGFVGLVNLGATCYLATCMQHLFMIPQLRHAVLSIEDTKNVRHGEFVRELQRMFTFLVESERKAYNPRNFCKVYTMDNHPLNIAEQTDMTEFLTDLMTKLEESSPQMRQVIKLLFSGTLSNNVVSLDCPHISRTTEEFYTLRAQVADLRNLNESLDELTVKDTLEGDNMYTCSACEKKVRAEKRACINKLPRILCFNTMRYTFNMSTMTKEKVNTHFSFPLKLDMGNYLEENLMKRKNSSDRDSSSAVDSGPDEHNLETTYDLIGVTVHTGNADGGHYYCLIRDCEDQSPADKPKWYIFNDAEVKPWDVSQIEVECYGGELTTKSYDAINDRFMDFAIERTNSAYMLFYKRCDYKYNSQSIATRYLESDTQRATHSDTSKLPKHLSEWIWADNMKFCRDKNVFEHNYFNFVWQICANVPRTLGQPVEDAIAIKTVHLAIAFVLGVLMNSRERPNLSNWTDLIRKQFNSSKAACEWLMHLIDDEETWLKQMLMKCPIEMVRQLFQRLCNDLTASTKHKKVRLNR